MAAMFEFEMRETAECVTIIKVFMFYIVYLHLAPCLVKYMYTKDNIESWPGSPG